MATSSSTQTASQKELSTPFDSFSSKIRRIYIPLAGFRYFHRPSEVNDVDPYFIGREQISRQLSNWLSDTEGNYTGAYLITGYRGMGKTSFVSKVLDNLIKEQDQTSHNRHHGVNYFIIYCIVLIICVSVSFLIRNAIVLIATQSTDYYPIIDIPGIIIIGSCILLLLISYVLIRSHKGKYQDWKTVYPYLIDLITVLPLYAVTIYLFFPTTHNWIPYCVASLCFVYSIILFAGRQFMRKFESIKRKYILQIKVNIGNEVSDTKDVLALFAYSIRNHISAYIHTKGHTFLKYMAIRGIQWSIVAFVGILLFEYALPVLQPVAWRFYDNTDNSLLLRSLEALNNIFYQFGIQHKELARWVGMFIACFVALGVTKVIRLLLNYTIKYAGGSWPKATEIIQELDKLCERIDATVQEDKGSPQGNVSMSVFNISLSRRTTKNYRPASIREIEQQLINIIHKINDSKILNCRMIVILDELDKLSCKQSSEANANIVYPEFTVNENGVSDDISVNEKKHRILSLLGQLKFFITSAKAKFIFIAGHELYDAYLADVSDREYSVSSIFNGVINVDSFFTCERHIKDITHLTEYFLCKHLMLPDNVYDEKGSQKNGTGTDNDEAELKTSKSGQDATHKADAQYTFDKYAELIRKDMDHEPGLSLQEIETVLVFLRQFVTYLAFMSNGAPKKLITTLEKYIISNEEYNNQKIRYTPSIITFPHITGKGNTKEACYYLAFGYSDQQKIGFIHYIANPIFENIISPSSEFGDKLLVASSFLIAHIYKYHNCGFSKRNLEYMPELLDSNRSPELRSFIDSIIGYLGQIHLTSITSGIYTYKFPMRLSEEISLFSKKFEEISAIFNFSLDDSLAVKKLYYRLFEFYHQKQTSAESIKSAFHHNLGDIHLANKEYTEAIAQYRLTALAIDTTLKMQTGKSTDCACIGSIASQIMRYTRVMLKLGLAYEKWNSLDSAYTIYNTLTTRLIAFREIEESPFGLTHSIVRSSENDTNDLNPDCKRVLLYKQKTKKSKFERECYQKTEDDPGNLHYWTYGDELTDNLCDQLSPRKYALISKLSVFEDLRLAYLPILAKLFVLEKHNICGITKDNIKVAEAEFRYLFHITNSKDKYLLRVDFYRKLGDVLYYKNGVLYKDNPDSVMSMISNWGYDLRSAIFDYCYRTKVLKKPATEIKALFEQPYNGEMTDIDTLKNRLKLNEDQKSLSDHIDSILNGLPMQISRHWPSIRDCHQRRNNQNENGERTLVPCAACNYYARSLSVLLYRLTGEEVSANTAYQFLKVYEKGTLLTNRYNELTQTALALSSMGNVLLSCAIGEDQIQAKFITSLFKSPTQRNDSQLNFLKSPHSHLERAILHYWTAMHYHNLASNHKEGILCLTWIFNIISGYLAEIDTESETCKFKEACTDMESAVRNALVSIHSMRDYAGLKETNKMKTRLIHFNMLSNLGLNSVMPDAEELLLVYYEVLLSQLSDKTDKDSFSEYLNIISYLYNSPSLTYMRNESLTYNRAISLLFKAKLNERLLWLLNGKRMYIPQKIDSIKLDLEIFAEIVKCLNIKEHSSRTITTEFLMGFLIADSIFCLTSIINFIQPTVRTSLFTNSFCLSIYKRLYHWVAWKEWFVNQKEFKAYDLENNIRRCIEVQNLYMLKQTYLKGMINKYYDAARAMHSAGHEYQTFISDMYLLDDDLQNNTCQFYFALERYKIRASRGGCFDTSDNNYFAPKSYFKTEYK